MLFEDPFGGLHRNYIRTNTSYFVLVFRPNIIAGVLVPSRLHFPSENEISRHDFGYMMDWGEKLLSLMWNNLSDCISFLMKKSRIYHVY